MAQNADFEKNGLEMVYLHSFSDVSQRYGQIIRGIDHRGAADR